VHVLVVELVSMKNKIFLQWYI